MKTDILKAFETASVRMDAMWRVAVQVPVEEADALMSRVCDVVPLTLGCYDRCAFQSAGGIERYRPREGAPAGVEDNIRLRPGVVEVAFQIPRDQAMLVQVVEVIVAAHSYQEPVIMVCDVLASRAKGGNEDNPNRWWNKGGDWMKQP